jgi:hypothetical protein
LFLRGGVGFMHRGGEQTIRMRRSGPLPMIVTLSRPPSFFMVAAPAPFSSALTGPRVCQIDLEGAGYLPDAAFVATF